MSTNFQIDIKYVDDETISCNGSEWSSESHPLIYLDLSSGKVITCPYCSMKFKRK